MTTKRIKIEYAGCETSYGRASDPEGFSYNYRNGVYLRAVSRGSNDHGTYTDQWIYHGLDGCEGQHECFTEEAGADLADRIKEKGSIDPDLWWCCERNYDHVLPDYVVDWSRPEFN